MLLNAEEMKALAEEVKNAQDVTVNEENMGSSTCTWH